VIGNLGFIGAPRDLTNLRAEKSVSANDVPHRLAFAAISELPVGCGKAIGRNMNRIMNGAIGGWQVIASCHLPGWKPHRVLR
jgi:hypothetical protein